jgi:hypothetical protein
MSLGQRKRVNISLLIPFLVIPLVFGVLLWKKYQASREISPKPQIQQPAGARKAVLFFVAGGSRLAREARELEPCDGTAACVKVVLDELFNGPVGDLDEALPDGATFKGVGIEGDMAVVDLSQSFADELPSGSSAEMMAVYSIVDTVGVNFPQLTKVKLTIEGKGNIVLEHLDLSEPLIPDYSLEQDTVPTETGKPAPASAPAAKAVHP